MSQAKIAIMLAEETVRYLDAQVTQGRYASRSQAVQEALDDMIARRRHGRVAEASARPDRDEKRTRAERGLDKDSAGWPSY